MKCNVIWGAVVVAGFSFLISCDKDEKPKPAGITFEIDYQEVTESDGTFESFHPALTQGQTSGREIEVKLILDKPLAETAVISFSVDGTALANSASNSVGDFEIEDKNLIIEKGATEAIISIQLYEDTSYEYTDYNDDGLPFENVTLKLETVVSGPITIGEENITFQLDILEDDALIFLLWDPQDVAGDGVGDVDMDLFVWFDNELWDASAEGGTDQEYVILAGAYPDGIYNLSYTYYEGTSDDLAFSSYMFGNINNQAFPYPETPFISNGTYKLVNKNTYVSSNTSPPDVEIVQSLTKSGVNFTNVTDILEPASSSRLGKKSPVKLTPELLRRLKIDASTKELQGKSKPAFLKP